MSTADEYSTKLNSYRQSHGISTIQKDYLLCSNCSKICEGADGKRKRHDHAGFDKYAQNQNEFSTIGEVLFGGGQPPVAFHREWDGIDP